MPKKETEKIERALKLVIEKGYSYKKAAREVGLHWSTVERWAHRAKGLVLSPHARKLLTRKVFGVTEIIPEPSLWQRIKNFFGL